MNDILGQPAREALGLTTRRCTATSKGTGERCGRAPILGGFLCQHHGGAAPQVRQAAKERLLMLVEPALEVLYRATRNAPPCPVCGRSDADRDPTAVKAAGMILDRTGFHPTLTVQQQPVEAPAYLAWLPADRLAQIGEWITEAKVAMVRGEPLPDELVPDKYADAVLVEPHNEPEPSA